MAAFIMYSRCWLQEEREQEDKKDMKHRGNEKEVLRWNDYKDGTGDGREEEEERC